MANDDLLGVAPDYTMGFSEDVLQSIERNTAEAKAKFLLPYLRPGHRILDLGSGMGTVSAGLAKAVEPGELHGVDVDEEAVGLAKAVVESQRVGNAKFRVGDATNLPFEDGYFDVVHCRNVLMFIPDTQAALAEVRRVLKPGGIIGCREMILASCFNHPGYGGVLRRAWDLFEDLLKADDCHPQMGKDLKGHLVRAGFENPRFSASFEDYITPSDVAFIYNVAQKWFIGPEFAELAVTYGVSTLELCDEMMESYEKWVDDPLAVCGIAHGEAIASKP